VLLPHKGGTEPCERPRPNPQSRNRLLNSLSIADFGLLQPNLESLALEVRQVLEKPNRRIDDVYFIDSGFASVVAVQAKETTVEVGLIGREGMTGLAIVLGNDRSPQSTYIQAAGRGQHIDAIELRKAMNGSPSLQGLLLKYVQAFMVQTTQTAISNARGKLNERLARWILMADDRIDEDRLPLTHEFLSLMLGVRRAGVTEALHALERQRLIRSSRGEIIVRNRKGTERRAGGSYGIPEAEFRRLIG
jgi:CRP-like cAMP-binding protein